MQNIVSAGSTILASDLNAMFEKSSILNIETFEANQQNLTSAVVDNTLKAVCFPSTTDFASGVFSIPVRKINRNYDVYLKGIFNFPTFDNNVLNGDIESIGDTTQRANSWLGGASTYKHYATLQAGTGTAGFSNTVFKAGASSIAVVLGAASSQVQVLNRNAGAFSSTECFAVKPSTKYKLSCWIKTDTVNLSATSYIGYQGFTSGGVTVSNPGGAVNITGATILDWTKFESVFTTGATEVYMNYLISLTTGAGGACNVWIDDIRVVEVDANNIPVKKMKIDIKAQYNASSTLKLFQGLFNGNFEKGTGSQATTANWIGDITYGWAFITQTATGTASYDTTYFKGGLKSMKLNATASGAGQAIRVNTQLFLAGLGLTAAQAKTGIPIKPNTQYLITYQLKMVGVTNANSGGCAMNRTEYNEAGGNPRVNSNDTYLNGTVDWQQRTISFTSGAYSDYLFLQPTLLGETGACYFDDIKIEEVNIEQEIINIISVENSTNIQSRDIVTIPHTIITGDDGVLVVEFKKDNLSLSTLDSIQQTMQLCKLIALQ